jgi:diguanylate cyclase (GGDEF)-like protein
MNLNNFREINNTLGHQNGDALLRQVAATLQATLWESDMVACLGGDEFAVLLARLADHRDIELVLQKILGALRRPVSVVGVPINVEASFGIAIYPEHGEAAETLWQRADIALRAAKEKQRDFLVYRPDIDHHDPSHLALLGELGAAIDRNELVLHYQPTLHLASGRAIGAEALVRWQHPVRGLVYPDGFVPLAERTQLINPLTACVLANALRQGQVWEREGLPLSLSVNLSARNLQEPELGARIVELARSSRFPLQRLTVEVTETAIMADSALAKKVLTVLHEAGISISMDDFGIGQSSLAYLKDLPISRMKIDKSFVMGFGEARNAAIVRSAVALAHNLGLGVTAEGVENEETLVELREMGCDLAQGYYIARPMPVDRASAWFRERAGMPRSPVS